MSHHVVTPAHQDTPVIAFLTPHIAYHCGACGGTSRYQPYQRCLFCHPACHRVHVPWWLVRLAQWLRGLWPS